MNKLERLLQKAKKLQEPGAGTVQEYNETLLDLGRHVLNLYVKGKLKIEKNSVCKIRDENLLNLSSFVKEAGKYPPAGKDREVDECRFTEAIAYCHLDLSKVTEEAASSRYHVTYNYYRGDNNPRGVPAALADLILRVFRICNYYEIDIETVMNEKHEHYKKNLEENKYLH